MKLKALVLTLVILIFTGLNLSAEESKSDRIARISDQLCRHHTTYIDTFMNKIIYTYRTLNTVMDKLPKEKLAGKLNKSILEITYEIDDIVAYLQLQSTMAVNACVDYSFGPRRPSLVDRIDDPDQVFEKKVLIAGLRDEMCDIYVDDIGRIVTSLTSMLEDLETIQSNTDVQTYCVSEMEHLKIIDKELTHLLNVMKNEHTVTKSACGIAYDEASKSEFWRAALPAFEHQAFINPYLVLMFIYD